MSRGIKGKRCLLAALTIAACLVVFGCSKDPVEKRTKHMEKADGYADVQKFKEAIIEYRNAIQADPKFPRAYHQIAQAYLRTGQPREAYGALIRGAELDPDNVEAQLKLGQFHLLAKRTKEAGEIADLVLKKQPENIDALFLQIGVLLQEGKTREAVLLLERVTELDADNIRAHISLARIAGTEKRYDEAESHLKRAVQVHPDQAAARLELARFYEQRGEVEEAERELQQALAGHPDNVELLRQLGNFHMRRGAVKKAEEAYLQMASLKPDEIAPMMTVSAFYASQKDLDTALSWMKKAMELQPGNLEIQNAVANLHMDMGKVKEAEEYTDKVLQKDGKNQRALLMKARLLLGSGKAEEAAPLLEGLTKDHPDHAAAYYYLGLAHMTRRDLTKAKAALLKAVEFGPGNVRARMLLAETYLGERAADLALEQLEFVVSRQPEDYRAQVLKGNALLLKGNRPDARKAYVKATEISPDDPLAHYQLGTLDRFERRYDDALVRLQKVLELQPTNVRAIGGVVAVYASQAKLDDALSFLDRQLLAHKDLRRLAALLEEMRGGVLVSLKDLEKSETAFKRALELDPDLVAPYLSLARLYLQKKETDKAVGQYEKILEKRPDFVQALMALGALYDAQGDTKQARAMYEKALTVDPDFAPAANNLAWILLNSGEEIDRALTLARRAKARLPQDPSVADTLGLAYIAKGLYESAIPELEDAAEKMPGNATVFYHLALAYSKTGRKAEAVKALQTALQIKQPFQERDAAERLLRELEA